ncbi:MAG: hypothetical protein HN582_00355 [Marinovum sp.]|jgi:hypothetical protein|nr:hypothetical protein [Marinovum sp.]MBT7905930.1 hypothetical protein [Marinovum sp.]
MKKYYFVFGFLALTCSCTGQPGGLAGEGPTHKIDIDGKEIHLRAMKANPNSYTAYEWDIWGGLIDPSFALRNIQAIEKHTGCKVISNSVYNQGVTTTATVDCSD